MRSTEDALARAARYRHPRPGAVGRWIARVVHAPGWIRARRWLTARIPLPPLASDVAGVAYMSWWLPLDRLPPPPRGYRFCAFEGRTPFTILTYRHGGFGPAWLGPLRRLLPSPLQSNWRWYLQRDDAAAGEPPVVLFAANVMDSLLHVAGARLLSDAMQPQLPARMRHRADGGAVHTVIEPGQGGAPALVADLCPQAEPGDEAWWRGRFGSRREAWRFLACQGAAIAVSADGREAITTIDLPVDVDRLQPLGLDPATFACPTLEALGADPFDACCFLLPRVPFRVVAERLL